MFSPDLAATTGAPTDPHPVLGHSGSKQGRQLGDVDQIHSFFRQFATAAWAALLRDHHSYWRSGDIFGPQAWRKEKVPSPGLRPGRLGSLVRVPLEKGVA